MSRQPSSRRGGERTYAGKVLGRWPAGAKSLTPPAHAHSGQHSDSGAIVPVKVRHLPTGSSPAFPRPINRRFTVRGGRERAIASHARERPPSTFNLRCTSGTRSHARPRRDGHARLRILIFPRLDISLARSKLTHRLAMGPTAAADDHVVPTELSLRRREGPRPRR